jgi:hypothetical protein
MTTIRYQWLKSILGATAAQQAECSLLHWVDASILLPANPKYGGQRATQRTLDVGKTSSPEGFLTCNRPGRPSTWSEPPTYWHHHLGYDGTQSKQYVWNLRHGGGDDHEGCNLSPKGSCPKVFGGAVRNTRSP